MIKLRDLLPESYDPMVDEYYRVWEQMNNEWNSGQKHQSWRLVPKRLLDAVWRKFVKYGRADEKGLEKIWEIVIENITKIGINSDIRDGNNVDIFDKESYREVTEQEWDRFFNFISDRSGPKNYGRGGDQGVKDGHARYSDRSRSLYQLAGVVEKASTPEEKLLAIDKILNFVHGLGDMAGWFVEGGANSLTDLSNMNINGIHLTGKLSERKQS